MGAQVRHTKMWDGTKILGTFYGAAQAMTMHHCGTCGCIFAVTQEFDNERCADHQSFECPWCNASFTYSQESKLEREKRLRVEAEARAQRCSQREQATRDLLQHEERSHAATRGHLTRAKRRAHAGVCPVQGCKRHFKDLERHMECKHPDYAKEAL